MFGLTYLSNDRQRTLRKLQDRLTTTTDSRTRNETNLLIQEIMAEAKSYTACDKFDLQELKNQLLDKMATLAGLGKAQSVEMFEMHLKDVDFHLQTLLMAEALQEKNRLRTNEPPNLRDHSTSLKDLTRDKRKQKAMGRTRWVIGMDEDADS